MLLLGFWSKRARKELLALEREVLNLGLGESLSLLLADDLENSHLSPWRCPLADSDKTLRWRETEEVDGISVGGARDEHLDAILDIVNDDVVTCDVHEFLFFVHLQAVVEVTVATKDKLGRNGYSLHAHIGHDHDASFFLEIQIN